MGLYKILMKVIGIFLIFLSLLLWGTRVECATGKVVPKITVGYVYNDNVGAVDPDLIDPIEMQWLAYLVGADANFRSQYTLLSLGGSAGFNQYISSSSELDDLLDVRKDRFNYYVLDFRGSFQYFRSNFTLEIGDELKRNRRLSEIFGGVQSADLSEIYLYTNNLAYAQISFRPTKSLNCLLRYEYEIILFDEPVSEYLPTPADASRHGGLAKFSYGISPKLALTLDLQAGQWIYDESKIPIITVEPDGDIDIDEEEVDVADYNYYLGLLGMTYSFSPKTTLMIAGGAEHRQYFGEPEGRNLEDATRPIARVSFNTGKTHKYGVSVLGEYSSSRYGQNLYFNYYHGVASFTYYFARPLYATIAGSYLQSIYDLENNDYGNIWSETRIDNTITGQAGIIWEALRKYDVPYLTLKASYSYSWRDSNIDGEIEDYVEDYPGVITSYDTEVQVILFQVQFAPTVYFGAK